MTYSRSSREEKCVLNETRELGDCLNLLSVCWGQCNGNVCSNDSVAVLGGSWGAHLSSGRQERLQDQTLPNHCQERHHWLLLVAPPSHPSPPPPPPPCPLLLLPPSSPLPPPTDRLSVSRRLFAVLQTLSYCVRVEAAVASTKSREEDSHAAMSPTQMYSQVSPGDMSGSMSW